MIAIIILLMKVLRGLVARLRQRMRGAVEHPAGH